MTGSTRAWLSFRRIVDVPFGTCVAALDSGQLTGPDRGPRAGACLVCGPAEHDPDAGTCRVQVRLARGPLRPPLRMRLQADHWSSSPPRTALELIPCGPVRPTAAYFRAGHQLLDTLARSLARQEHPPTRRQEHDMALFMDYHEDLRLPAEALVPADGSGGLYGACAQPASRRPANRTPPGRTSSQASACTEHSNMQPLVPPASKSENTPYQARTRAP